jgi:hypothetical protein
MSEKPTYSSLHEEEAGVNSTKPKTVDAGATFVLESKGLILSNQSEVDSTTIEIKQSCLIQSLSFLFRIIFHS